MKNIALTIGIAAYNEEKNIKGLLEQILKLNRNGWQLQKIIINCDGCSDKTTTVARSVKSSLIQIIEHKTRKGKSIRLNEIFTKTKNDVLVLFDADIAISDLDLINKLIKELKKDASCMVVGGNTRPIPPVNFFQRAVYSTFLVFDQSRKKMRKGNNIFGCNGACLALKTTFTNDLKLPKVINDDDYIYFSCIAKGFNFRYVPTAIVYYKLPNGLRDYLRQSFRSNPDAVIMNLKNHFGSLVEKEYYRPFRFYVESVFQAFKEYPLETLYISTITLFCKPFYSLVSKNFQLKWFTAQTTK